MFPCVFKFSLMWNQRIKEGVCFFLYPLLLEVQAIAYKEMCVFAIKEHIPIYDACRLKWYLVFYIFHFILLMAWGD